MKYCTKCGKQLFDEAVICPGCGCPTGTVPAQQSTNNMLVKLSERLKINGIIWIAVAVLQILIGISGAFWVLIIGALNIYSAVKDLTYSKTVLQNPYGIVKNFEPLTSPIITLVYNLVVGGVIGIAGSIYYFIALRGFVMENRDAFLVIESTVPPQYPNP